MRNRLQCCWIPLALRAGSFGKGSEGLWRLRINFFVIIVLGFLGGIGYTSILSSFHQFITNPTYEDLEGTRYHHLIQHGLGKSEFFYSWTITTYSIGEVVFAPIAGYATVWIPYWYILMAGVLSHTFGYLLYSLSTSGWMILLSRLLTGAFAGVIETLAYSYISERESDYEAAHAKVSEANNVKVKPMRIKEYMYAFLTVSITLSYLIGPGVSALVAQFPDVDQFRWVGYFNVVLGILAAFFIIILFHGEYKCNAKMNNNETEKAKCWKRLPQLNGNCIRITILLFFLVASYVTDTGYAVVDTLFNPILSGSFGFTEKETSYYFVGVMVVYVMGSLLLVLFSALKLNNRLVIIFGVLASIVGSALIADWQAIGNDPCREYSGSHPILIDTNVSISNYAKLNNSDDYFKSPLPSCTLLELTEQGLSSNSKMKFFDIVRTERNNAVFESRESPLGVITDRMSCRYSKKPILDCMMCNTTSDSSCMSFKITSSNYCIEFMLTSNSINSSTMSHSTMQCELPEVLASLCVDVVDVNSFTESEVINFKGSVIYVVEVLLRHNFSYDELHERTNITSYDLESEEYDYDSAAMDSLRLQSKICTSHEGCRWNQLSSITNTVCFSCPPICRSVERSLNFVQFSLGVTVFVMAIPISRVILMILISDNLNRNKQGPFFGIIVAAGGIARTVSPLWVDAAYESVDKRTFLPMSVNIAFYSFILLGLILLYKVLQPAKPDGDNKSDSNSEDENEAKLLIENSKM